jgi:alpha-L-fucosidase
VRNLVDIASKGGNYLLNVGPTPEGEVPMPSIERLKEVGAWMKENGEAIYGTKASPFSQLAWGRVTQKAKGGNTMLYVSVFEWPKDGKLVISGLENKILKAYPLAEKNIALKIEAKEAEKIIDVKAIKQSVFTTVLVLEIKGKPVVNNSPSITSESSVFTDKIEFNLSGNTVNGEIRYTTDGTTPTAVSALANGTISVNATQNTTVKAASFVKGKRVSAVSETTYKIEKPIAPAYSSKPGIRYNYYEGSWEKLPDFSKLTPVKSGVVDNFNINERKVDLYYGFTFDGFINVPETAVYAFYLKSDDGSKLIIDDTKVLDNDGMHGMDEKRLDVALEKGLHKISIQFFQHGGGQGLKLEWKQMGKERKLVDKSVMTY